MRHLEKSLGRTTVGAQRMEFESWGELYARKVGT